MVIFVLIRDSVKIRHKSVFICFYYLLNQDSFCGKMIAMRKLSRKNGFSLVEMLIVVGIVIFLTGMVVAYSSSTGRKMMLYAEQAKVAGVLNRAKSLALQKYSVSGGASVCAFGVEFSLSGAYKIFQVAKESSGTCDVTKNYTDLDSFTLLSGVQFTSLPQGSDPALNNRIVFKAPYLTVYNAGNITLRSGDFSPPREVKIDVTSAGGISLISM